MAAANTSWSGSGANLGPYALARELGARRAATYAAQERRSDGSKVLAVLERVARTGDASAEAALVKAARIVGTLAHPNIVRVRDALELADEVVIVSDYVEAERYDVVSAAATKAGRALKLVLHLRVLVDVLGGLSALHLLTNGKGAPARLLHGETCPANVLLSLDGNARLSHVCRVPGGRNAPESLGYAAPEVRAAEQGVEASERADVYSCGVMLWEALTGKRLFPGDSDARILARQREGQLELATVPAELEWAAPLAAIAARALRSPPQDRFATAAKMAAEVRKVAGARLALKSAVAAVVKELAGERIAERRRALLAPVAPAPSAHIRKQVAMPTPAVAIPSEVLARALVDALPGAAATRDVIPEAATATARKPDGAMEIGEEMLLHATVGTTAAAPTDFASSEAPTKKVQKPPPPPSVKAKPPLPSKADAPAGARAAMPTPLAAPVSAIVSAAAASGAAAPSPLPGLVELDGPKIELAVDLSRKGTPMPVSLPLPARRGSMPDAQEAVFATADPTGREASRARSRKIVFAVLAAMVLLLAAAGARVATRAPEASEEAPAGSGAAASVEPPPVPVPVPPSTNVAVPEPVPTMTATATATVRAPARSASPAATGKPAGPRPKKPYDPLGI